MSNEYILVEHQQPPKDGTLLNLLVRVVEEEGEDNWFPTEDSHIFRTIGFNILGDVGEDYWHMVGWNWCSDNFIDISRGEVIGWAPLPRIPSKYKEEYTGDEE